VSQWTVEIVFTRAEDKQEAAGEMSTVDARVTLSKVSQEFGGEAAEDAFASGLVPAGYVRYATRRDVLRVQLYLRRRRC